MRKRLWAWLLIFSLLSVSVTGCFGKKEVEELGFVMAVGIDPGKQKGIYEVTFEISLPKKGGEGGGPSTQKVIYTAEGSSMRDAEASMLRVFSRRPFLGSSKVIIIGAEAAQTGMNKVLDFFQRYYEFRRTMYLVTTQGKARELLETETRFDTLASSSIRALMDQNKIDSTFPVVRLGHYLTVLSSGSTAPVLPAVNPIRPGEERVSYPVKEGEKGPSELSILRVGVFDGDRLKDFLDETATKGFLWLTNDVSQRYISVNYGEQQGYFVSGRVTKSSTKWKLEQVNGTFGIRYTVNVEFDLDELARDQKERTPEEWLQMARQISSQAITKQVYEECEKAINKSKELKLDFLGIGRHIEAKQPAYWKRVKDQWQENLPDFPVAVDVKFEPQHAGASYNPPVNPPGKGQE